MGVSAILKVATASLNEMISQKITYKPYCRSFSWFYEFIYALMKAFSHSNMTDTYCFPWYHLTQRSLLRISILWILVKVRKNFLPAKKRSSWPQFTRYQSKICTDCSLL